MKTLPVSYQKDGDQFDLIERKGDVCVYSQSDENGIYAYEVFKVQKTRKCHINGENYPKPGSNTFKRTMGQERLYVSPSR